SLFADTLALPSVTIDDHFFHRGGHSLLATRLTSKIREAFGVRLGVREIFQYPTVVRLAELIAVSGGADERPALVAGERPERPPLSFAQQRLWFLDQLEGPSPTYNIPLAVRLTGTLDAEALRRALVDVIGRHEALRTTFPSETGTPHQAVRSLAETDLALPVTPVTEESLHPALARLAGVTFDLATDLPIRADLLALSPEEHVLLVVMHHIASDGWSNGPLLRDLATAYAARSREAAPAWAPLPVQYADYSLWQRSLLATEEERQLAFWTAELAELPEAHLFDLATELPLHAALFQLEPTRSVLVLVVHHIASDGWSNTPLMRDLGTAYAARAEGGRPGWEPLPVQYADYALWQRDLLAEQEDTQLDHWRTALAALPAESTLPADRPRPAVASYRGTTHTVHCPTETHQALTALARESGATLFMVVQAATVALLSRSGAGTDIPVGSLVAGRTDEALEDLVGFFVNTLVLRTDAGGDPTFRELLDRVRETDLAAWAHQDLPFDRLVEALNPERSAAHHPLFQVMLTLAEAAEPAPALPGIRSETGQPGLGIAKFDLTVNFYEHRDRAGHPNGLDIVLEYATDLYDPATIETAADRLTRVLDAVIADPDVRVADIELLTTAQRRALLDDYNDTSAALPEGALHELFAAQAVRTPDAVALVCGDRELS
ncbi:condensation domain-containing protein, partial [Streptomyces sp. 900105245]